MPSPRASSETPPVAAIDAGDPGAGAASRELLLPAAVGALVLITSLLNFLHYNGYPLLAPEVGLLVAALVIAAAAVGVLYKIGGRFGRLLLDVLLAYIAFDLNFDGLWVAIAAVATAVLLNRHLIQVLGVVFLVAFATELVGFAFNESEARMQAGPLPAATTDAPVLLHLILDEHLGIEGFPATMPDAAAVRKELQAFYAKRGFRLFGGAYSEYLHTVNSIPQILNFGTEQPWSPEHGDGAIVANNAYFDRLRELGYGIRVYQTDFLDYCAGQAVRSCTAYRAADIGPIAAASLPAGDKAALVMHEFWSLSDAATVATRLYDLGALRLMRYGIELPLVELEHHRTSTVSALIAFDRLIADLRRAQPGEAYFAHFLLPHYPYVTDRDCALKAVDDWEIRALRKGNTATRHLGYFDQLRCAAAKLDLALAALAASPAGSRSVVIVHGDHGSRITRNDPTVENANLFDARDMIAGYSTLFAVRAADIAPGYDAARLPVARLLSALARSGFQSTGIELEQGFTPNVVLEDERWRPVRRVALPDSWARP